MRILVTGAGTWTGGRVVQRLELRPDTTVLAVDDVAPRLAFESEFAAGRLDDLAFAERLHTFHPDRVIHLGTLERPGVHGNVVVGAQALFGAIARSADVTGVIVRSDGAIYGAGPRSPSVVDEQTKAVGATTRYQRRLSDLEQAAADLAARRPEMAVAVLRFAPVVGPTIANPISRYLTLPVVPTQLGFDPRLQLIYGLDAVRALLHAMDSLAHGTFNVASPGQLYLSRMLRLGRRLQQPLPKRLFRSAVGGLGPLGTSLGADLRLLLRYGRVLDITALGALGFSSALTCRQSVLATYRRVPAAAMPEEVAGG